MSASNNPNRSSSNRLIPALNFRSSVPSANQARIQFYVDKSIETSTTASRRSAWRLWQNFTTIYTQAPPLPSDPEWVCVFIQHYFESGYSSGSLITYLSHIGACYTSLGTTDWPTIRQHSMLKRLLEGIKKVEVINRQPNREPSLLTLENLRSTLVPEQSHDFILFNVLLLCGFFGLHRLAEITDPAQFNAASQHAKRIKIESLTFQPDSFQYTLPYHKGDRFSRSSIVTIEDAFTKETLQRYLTSRRRLGSPLPYLFLLANGRPPTKAWFLPILQHQLPNSSGKSLRRGGATALAKAGAPPEQIQEAGRWSSDAWKIYVRDHPALAAILRQNHHNH